MYNFGSLFIAIYANNLCVWVCIYVCVCECASHPNEIPNFHSCRAIYLLEMSSLYFFFLFVCAVNCFVAAFVGIVIVAARWAYYLSLYMPKTFFFDFNLESSRQVFGCFLYCCLCTKATFRLFYLSSFVFLFFFVYFAATNLDDPNGIATETHTHTHTYQPIKIYVGPLFNSEFMAIKMLNFHHLTPGNRRSRPLTHSCCRFFLSSCCNCCLVL